MLNESRKIMSLPDLPATTTCVRVPVMRAHAIAVHAEFERPVDLEAARQAIETFDGAELCDDPASNVYPTPLQFSGKDKCGVGRLRIDSALDNGLAFFVVGVPGILLAILVRYTLREPARGMAEGRVDQVEQPGIKETFQFMWRKRSFRHLAFGGALTAFVGYGVVTWVPSFLIRSHGMETGEVGTWLGLILGIPGGIGIALGGYMADKLGASDTRWYLWIVSVALLAGVPFAFGVYLSDSALAALLFLIMPIALGNFYQATTFSQTQGLATLRMRSVAAAVLLFILNIIGLGAGPQAVGIVSDLLNPTYGQESLRYSLLIFSFVNIWSAYHYYVAGKYLEEELETD